MSSETNQTLRDIQVKYQQIQIESKDSRTKYDKQINLPFENVFFFRTENDLETKQKEIEIHQNELARLRQQLSQIELNHLDLQNHFEQLKQTNQQLEKHLEEKDQSKRNLDLLVDQHRQQFDDEKQLRISTSIDSKFVFFLFSLSKILKINWKFFELKIRKQKSISNN